MNKLILLGDSLIDKRLCLLIDTTGINPNDYQIGREFLHPIWGLGLSEEHVRAGASYIVLKELVDKHCPPEKSVKDKGLTPFSDKYRFRLFSAENVKNMLKEVYTAKQYLGTKITWWCYGRACQSTILSRGDLTQRASGPPPVNPQSVRFILHPGSVRSVADGDIHWINATRLAGLYGVPLSKCIIAGRPDSRGYQERCGDIHLYPREDGNYTLPKKATMKAKIEEKVRKEGNQDAVGDKHEQEYVVCIRADSKRTLTLGKEYKVEHSVWGRTCVINDHGERGEYFESRFTPISEAVRTVSQPSSQHLPKEETTGYELDPLTGAKVHPVTKQPIETYVDFSKVKIL